MGNLTLVLGGARSGKSRYAQEIAEKEATGGTVLYIATGEPIDEEMEARIARHKQDRPAHWQTIEEPLAVGNILRHESEARVILIDCLTLFVTNHLLGQGDRAHCETESPNEPGAQAAVVDLIESAKACMANVIIVSNEVGMGLVPATPLGRVFRDVAGRANQLVAAAADRVVFMVAGLPMTIK
jgi:adenosylcobinamide kinase/adenosylcobinamide-phosphate guanylyltransferase